jgi:hypothetical protein
VSLAAASGEALAEGAAWAVGMVSVTARSPDATAISPERLAVRGVLTFTRSSWVGNGEAGQGDTRAALGSACP